MLASYIDGEVARLEQWLRRFEEDTTKVNARALPVIGLGIVLSGIPSELGHYWPLGFITLAFGLGLAVWASALIVRGRPRPSPSSPA